MPKVSARERILKIADELFYTDGIRASGVDTVIAKSNVAKTTLYRHFPSKDDLVVAYLEARNQQFWELLETEVEQDEDRPRQQLIATFAWLDSLLRDDTNCGCPFLMVASEFPDVEYLGHQVAIAHKEKFREHITALAQSAGIDSAMELSAALMLLMDGAFAQRRLFRQHDNGITLKKAASALVDAYS